MAEVTLILQRSTRRGECRHVKYLCTQITLSRKVPTSIEKHDCNNSLKSWTEDDCGLLQKESVVKAQSQLKKDST